MTIDIAEAEALAALHVRCFQEPRPWSAQEFSDLLATQGVFLCAEPDGFALGRVAGPEVELLTLAVAPEARRRGVGARLIASFEVEATCRGARDAFLEVALTNRAAIRLYERARYDRRGKRGRYYRTHGGDWVDALVMGRALD